MMEWGVMGWVRELGTWHRELGISFGLWAMGYASSQYSLIKERKEMGLDHYFGPNSKRKIKDPKAFLVNSTCTQPRVPKQDLAQILKPN